MSPMTVSVCLAVLVVTVVSGETRKGVNDKSCVDYKCFDEKFKRFENILSEALNNCCSKCTKSPPKGNKKTEMEKYLATYKDKVTTLKTNGCRAKAPT